MTRRCPMRRKFGSEMRFVLRMACGVTLYRSAIEIKVSPGRTTCVRRPAVAGVAAAAGVEVAGRADGSADGSADVGATVGDAVSTLVADGTACPGSPVTLVGPVAAGSGPVTLDARATTTAVTTNRTRTRAGTRNLRLVAAVGGPGAGRRAGGADTTAAVGTDGTMRGTTSITGVGRRRRLSVAGSSPGGAAVDTVARASAGNRVHAGKPGARQNEP